MGRIRTIKPEFWQDEDMVTCSSDAQLMAIGLLNHADDEGYFRANHALIRAAVFPLREDSLNIHGMLTELSNIGYLELFEGSDGKKYGRVRNFSKHQKVNRPSPSKIKELRVFTEPSLSPHGALTAGKEQGKEQGKELGASDEAPQKPPAKRFKPPTLDEVKTYCEERGNSVSPQKFLDHYEANGWVRGKTKIKDWKACVRTWEANDDPSAKTKLELV